MNEQELIELLKKNLNVCSWIENGSIHTVLSYKDIILSHSEDGAILWCVKCDLTEFNN